MWLIVKEDKIDDTITAFEGTGVNITLEGKVHLGAALGTRSFVTSHVKKVISGWVREVEQLSSRLHPASHTPLILPSHMVSSPELCLWWFSFN